MIHEVQERATDDASWLAIRHPAVVRLLERELAGPDRVAFTAGLTLACRVLGGRSRLAGLRLDHRTLAAAVAGVRGGRCDRAMVRSIRDQIAALPVVPAARDQDAVATVIAAILWSVLDAGARALDTMRVA
jgi:hypothetical protein